MQFDIEFSVNLENTMANVRDVADFLLQLSDKEPETTPITPLQLQKLLYYVQGWSIALRGNPIFPDPIEAWTHGPVVPMVYQEFKHLAGGAIPIPEREVSLSADERGLIRSVWEGYKHFSASGLRTLTHHEPPWLEARDGINPTERCRHEVSHATMRDFFRGEYAKRAMPGLEFERLELANREFDEGRGIPMEDVFAV